MEKTEREMQTIKKPAILLATAIFTVMTCAVIKHTGPIMDLALLLIAGCLLDICRR